MAEDVMMTSLPNEIIEIILVNPNLSMKDVANLSFSCKHLYGIIMSSNNVWKSKFFQRWPHLKEIYVNCEKQHRVRVWLEEVKASVNCRNKLWQQLSQMSTKYYKKQELSQSEFQDFDPLFRPDKGTHPLAYHFLVDELIDIIENPSRKTNLTHKYYAKKVVRYLKQTHLTDEWHSFLELPLEKQLLEQGATFVSQWSQPEKRVTYALVCAMLDKIVDQAKDELKFRYPGHSIFSTPLEELNKWKKNNINDHQWSINETKQVMAALCEVMFSKLGFHGSGDYYDSENSFIDKVLEQKQGIPMTLAIVFESVCRRVGVKCEPIILPSHFLLRWKEKYTNISDTDEIENFYIDVFNGGKFLTKRNCPRVGGVSKCPIERYNIQNASTVCEIVDRMASNIETAGRQRSNLNGRAARLRSSLELNHLVRPYNAGAILQLGRFYMSYSMDVTKLIDILSHIKKEGQLTSRGEANNILRLLQDYSQHVKEEETYTIEIKTRPPSVHYAIGMIMKHSRYNYMCVITGWDSRCLASPQWIDDMGVEELDGGANQPFYNVFANDGSCRYAAQENLVVADNPETIDHYEIGRYFYEFKGTHYEPIEEKAKEYPEDAEMRERLVQQHYS